MSRFGLRAFIDKLAKDDERHQQLARQLRALYDQDAPASEFVLLLNELKKDSVLPDAGWLCLTADLMEEEASRSATIVVGTDTEFAEKYRDLSWDLEAKLRDIIRSFAKRNPMPKSYLCDAIESIQEFVNDDLPKEFIVPEHIEQSVAKTIEFMPQTLRKYGFKDLASLFEQAPQDFKRLKEEGERFLIGMTYEEEFEQSLNNLPGDPNK
jgi:hypothetical protein